MAFGNRRPGGWGVEGGRGVTGRIDPGTRGRIDRALFARTHCYCCIKYIIFDRGTCLAAVPTCAASPSPVPLFIFFGHVRNRSSPVRTDCAAAYAARPSTAARARRRTGPADRNTRTSGISRSDEAGAR